MRILPLLTFTGCVVGVDQHLTLDEPVDEIRVHLASGEVNVDGRPGRVTLDGTIAGPSFAAPELVVEDGVLTVDIVCSACGGRLDVGAPPETRLLIVVDAGSLDVRHMAADADLQVDLGDAAIGGHAGGVLTVNVGTGAVDASLDVPLPVTARVRRGDVALEVPPGGYALDLDASTVDVDPDVTDDPDGPPLVVRVDRGSVTVTRR